MKKQIILLLLLIFNLSHSIGQDEEVGPLTANPYLLKKALKTKLDKVNSGTFDSTFIYISDTINLPIFDEFSTSKFQTYNADFGDLGVTSEKVYRLLDASNVPVAINEYYTAQQTFRRTFNISSGTNNDINFSPISVKIGDLTSYPVTHITTNVYPPYYIYDTLDFPNDPDTIWIISPEIFQDSATQFFAPLNDPSLIWLESEAFHNYTMALNPWTLGVATFDGLDENGYPYSFGSTSTNFADHLTSKPINMSGTSAADSVYLSFLYQPQGLCDEPEDSDSLILEFYAIDQNEWRQVWSAGGEAVSEFKVGHIRLIDPDYFKKGFQFRFKNYGGLSGSLDHFHLDYVRLRSLSGYQDTLFKDFAFVYPVNTLLKDYTSVPWDHYKANFAGKMSNQVQMVVRNNSNISENNQNGTCEIFYAGMSEGSFTMIGQDLSGGNINYAPRTTYYSTHDFSTGYHFDETKSGLSQEFEVLSSASAQFPNFGPNDSTLNKQIFRNYYSYDDGTAELAYGPTGAQARLAIQFAPYEADSLIGVMIHFVPSVKDVSNKLFILTVWDDNGGQPGNVIYEDESFFPRTPNYEFDKNLFTTYFLKDTMKLAISGVFYVGWRQFSADRLNVGLDMNIPNNNHTFYSVNNGSTWLNSSFAGSVMIRPLFSTGMDVSLGINNNALVKSKVNVYPNPVSNILHIDMDDADFKEVIVYNIQGIEVLKSNSKDIEVGHLPQGIYFVKIPGVSNTIKVIKN